jgi:hypothetical protein
MRFKTLKKNMQKLLALFLLLSIISVAIYAQNDTIFSKSAELKHSISTDPLLPLFNSFAILFEYNKTEKSSFIAGLWYGKSTETYPKMLEYPGYAVNISPIFAYRYYVWRNLHAEYQLYPGFTKYYEKNEGIFYRSFNLFNEFRVGYKFNFQFQELPLMLNLQFPVGFTLYDSNEPETFTEIRRQDPVFYIFYPNFYLGIRF